MLVSAVTKTKTARIAFSSKRNTEILKKIVLMSYTDCLDQTEGKKNWMDSVGWIEAISGTTEAGL